MRKAQGEWSAGVNTLRGIPTNCRTRSTSERPEIARRRLEDASSSHMLWKTYQQYILLTNFITYVVRKNEFWICLLKIFQDNQRLEQKYLCKIWKWIFIGTHALAWTNLTACYLSSSATAIHLTKLVIVKSVIKWANHCDSYCKIKCFVITHKWLALEKP